MYMQLTITAPTNSPHNIVVQIIPLQTELIDNEMLVEKFREKDGAT